MTPTFIAKGIAMPVIVETIDVHADTQRVYEMWTEFEHYSEFMPMVREVRRTGETLMHWTVEMNGEAAEWDLQVVQMEPEAKIVFQTLHMDPPVRSTITFDPADDNTRITYTLENVPADENGLGELLQVALRRYKEIAEQGPPTRWPSSL